MAFVKQTVIDTRAVLEDGQIHVREAAYIVDNVTLERVAGPRFHRYVVVPGEDVSARPQAVRRLAALEWTPAVIAAWLAEEAKRNQGI